MSLKLALLVGFCQLRLQRKKFVLVASLLMDMARVVSLVMFVEFNVAKENIDSRA